MKIKKTVISTFGESSSSFRPGVKTLFHKVSFFLRHTVEELKPLLLPQITDLDK